MQPTGATSTAFGVELEPAVEVVPEALAQLIAGPEGHGAFGLVQQPGGRAGTGLVGDAAAGEDVDDLGRAVGPSTWKRRTAGVMGLPLLPCVWISYTAASRIVMLPASAGDPDQDRQAPGHDHPRWRGGFGRRRLYKRRRPDDCG